MAGQEELHGYRHDQNMAKVELPQPEVSEKAHNIITDFSQALIHTPEFGFKLAGLYFQHQNQKVNLFTKPLWFEKGDSEYGIGFQKYHHKQEEYLEIRKHAKGTKGDIYRDWEEIRLISNSSVESEFHGGKIEHAKRINGNIITLNNTQTAIENINDFLTANFGVPQELPRISIDELKLQEADLPQEDAQLTKAELGEYAYKLVQDYRLLIGHDPAFQQKLGEIFFWFKSDDFNPLMQDLIIRKNEYLFSLDQQTNRTGVWVSVIKSGIDEERHPTTFVSAKAPGKYYYHQHQPWYDVFDPEDPKLNQANINHVIKDAGKELFRDGGDYAKNSPTAIRRSRNFLIENFGEPLAA